MALGEARLRPVAIVGESITSVSAVASVGYTKRVWRPTSFFGIGTTCGIHRPLGYMKKRVSEMEDAGGWRMSHERVRTFIISMSNP